jgi:hypothetical protein
MSNRCSHCGHDRNPAGWGSCRVCGYAPDSWVTQQALDQGEKSFARQQLWPDDRERERAFSEIIRGAPLEELRALCVWAWRYLGRLGEAGIAERAPAEGVLREAERVYEGLSGDFQEKLVSWLENQEDHGKPIVPGPRGLT